ncbi:unnamed protein product [Boreogadus saida]
MQERGDGEGLGMGRGALLAVAGAEDGSPRRAEGWARREVKGQRYEAHKRCAGPPRPPPPILFSLAGAKAILPYPACRWSGRASGGRGGHSRLPTLLLNHINMMGLFPLVAMAAAR